MTHADPTEHREVARFVDADLRGARFIRTDLSGAVMRGVDIQHADIDAPWLLEKGSSLFINGVDVVPLIDTELNRRFPGRAGRRAEDPEGLRVAWAALEGHWASTIERVATMPPGTVDIAVDGEWSFAETLRHLIMATDTWLRRAIVRIDQPYHPVGRPNIEYESDGNDMSVFATVTPHDLTSERVNPWAPEHRPTVRSCLHTILEEEWEHLRYALRDLDAIETAR